MATDEEFDRLLEENKYDEAVMRAECAVMERRPITLALLNRLPASYLNCSPLLLQVKAAELVKQGRLAEAKESLELALKSFGVMAMPGRFLSVMGTLTRISLRLGELAAAETMVRFLQDENKHDRQEPQDGEIVGALAFGSYLVRADGSDVRLLRAASETYIRDEMWESAFSLLVEHHVLFGEEMPDAEFQACLRRLKQRALTCPEEAWVPGVLLLDLVCRTRWEEAGVQLLSWLKDDAAANGLAYDTYVYTAIACFLAMPEEERRHVRAAMIDFLQNRRSRYIEDLRLLYAVLQTLQAELFLMENPELAEAARLEAAWVKGQLKLPERSYGAELTVPAVTSKKPQGQPVAGFGSDSPLWIRVKFLGGLSMEREGDEIRGLRWKRRKAQELFVYLLLQPKYTSPKERIIEELQLGEDPVKAANSLYVVIHQLKQTLHEHLNISNAVSMRDGLITFREDAVEYVDAERYMALIRVADQLWDKDRALAAEMYEEANLLYAELLPEFPYLTWLDSVREHVKEKQGGILRKLSLFARGQQDAALEEQYCRARLSLRPDDEEACQSLLRVLVREQKLGEAKQVLQSFTERLRSELGMEPSDATIKLLGGALQ